MENKLLRGAKIATIGLFISKLLGILYVIPMNALLSDEAMGMYGTSYTIYATFIQIALIGFPVGISKLISKYNGQKQFALINKTYRYTFRFTLFLSTLSFIVLFFGAKYVVKLIYGNSVSYDSTQLITTIQILSFTLLILPFLSLSRGYIQGFQNMLPSSINIVIEQFIRIIIIIGGVIVVTQILNIEDYYAIYIATSASFISALIAAFFIYNPFKRYYNFVENRTIKTPNYDKFVKTITLVAAISLPFIVLSSYKSSFEFINVSSINRSLSFLDLGNTYINQVNTIYTIHTQKLVVLVITVATGFIMSTIPSISAYQAKNRHGDIKLRVAEILSLTLLSTGFIAIFTAVFNEETYYMFYGANKLGSDVFRIIILSTVIYAIYNVVGSVFITLNYYKITAISFLLGMLSKIAFTFVFTYLQPILNYEPAYIFAFSSLVGYLFSLGYIGYYAVKNDIIDFKVTKQLSSKIIVSLVLTAGVTISLKYIYLLFIDELHYFTNLVVLFISGLISLLTILYLANRFKYLKRLFGINLSDLIKKVKDAFR